MHVLRLADEVVVVDGGAKVVAGERERRCVQDVVDALALTPSPAMDWTTIGSLTLIFSCEGKLIGEVNVLPPDYVRSTLWGGDRQLLDPPALMRWLVDHRVAPSKLR